MEETSKLSELLKRQKLCIPTEKLKADMSEIIACVNQLKVLHKHIDSVEEKRSRKLELEEQELHTLSLDLHKRGQLFEAEMAEHGRRCSEALKRKSVLEDEEAEKTKDLALILEQIKESRKQFVTVDKKLVNQRSLLEILSLELVSKEKELGCVRESIKLSTSDLKLKNKMVDSLNNQITDCSKKIDTKLKKLRKIQKLIKEQANELDVKHKQREEAVAKEKSKCEIMYVRRNKRHKAMLESNTRSSSEMEERANEIKAAETEANELNIRSEKLRQEVEGREHELDLLKNQIESEEMKLIQLKSEMEEETNRKKMDLVLILNKIEDSEKQLVAVDEELESHRRQLQVHSLEVVTKQNELECLGETRKHLKFELEEKEKRVNDLNNLISISAEKLDLKSKELGEVKKLIEELTNKLSDLQKQQPSAAPSEPVNEDSLLHHESLPSLRRDEISSVLRASPNPAEFVLDLVQEEILKGLDLGHSFLETLVLLFEELAKIERPVETQLQQMAKEVAFLWKRKIKIGAPKSSSLEVLAFLLFIVAYGLKKLINQEERVPLVMSIAQYEHAQTLLNSLDIKISDIVVDLITKGQNIPAVRLICLFRLDKDFSPTLLLLEEINILRRTALENRQAESSQAKDKDGERLRDILELVAEYDLQIDIPGNLIVKLMIQRESSTPLVRCSSNTQEPPVNLRAPKPELN